MWIRESRAMALAAIAYAALAAGCASAPASLPVAPGTASRAAQASEHAALAGGIPSAMLPGVAARLRPTGRRGPTGPLRASRDVNSCQYYGNDCATYASAENVLTYSSTLTKGLVNPQGTVTDGKGNWYIANTGRSNVLVLHAKEQQTTALSDAGQYPVAVSVENSARLVAVSNIYTTSYASGSVALYAGGSVTPTSTLHVADFVEGVGIAIDPSGNCFWSYNDATLGDGVLVEFRDCAGKARTVVSGLGYAGGVAFDKHGNLYYTDQIAGVYRCAGTRSCGLLSTGYGDPLMINFDAPSKVLWVADATGYLDAVDPQTGTILVSNPAVGGASDPPFGVAPDAGPRS